MRFLFPLCLWPAVALAGWNAQDVYELRVIGDSALAVDATGSPSMAFGGDRLYYAEWSGSAWNVETVDGSECMVPGERLSLAFDPAGNPAIAYVTEVGLRLAQRDGVSWSFELIDESGSNPSIAFDAAGKPAIAYALQGPPGELLLARWSGTEWSRESVSSDFDTGGPSLAFDPAGDPAVAWYHQQAVWLARFNGSAWDTAPVDGAESCYPALVFDPAGRPAVFYGDRANVRLARWNGAGWDSELVGSSSGPEELVPDALAFDAAGRPAATYVRQPWVMIPAESVYAHWDGSAWRHEAMGQGRCDGLGFDEAGDALVAFQHAGLDCARWDGAVWDFEAVSEGGRIAATQLALDTSGQPVIAYEDRSSRIGLSRWDGASWSHELVDAGNQPSLALAAAGHPAIAYLKLFEGLWLARWDGTGWSRERLDDGFNPSLSLDPDDYLAMAYENMMGRITLARWDGSSWSLDDIDDGSYPSLAFDPLGQAAVAYFNDSGLWLARHDGMGWSSESIDGAEWTPLCLSFGPDGRPAIAYVNGELRVARWDGAGWSLGIVDANGRAPSLAFAPSGEPAIAYTGADTLRFALWDGTGWDSEDVDDGYDGSLTFDGTGAPLVSYGYSHCLGDLRLAGPTGPATLYRGSVEALAPGWKASALPLTAASDDETPPFPLATLVPGTQQDSLAAGAVLILYRVLWSGDRPAGNSLRVAKGPAATELAF